MAHFRIPHCRAALLLQETRGQALLEFAITLPLLVVFIVGIYDFSGAFNQKQKIAQAAQEGAIIAGAQPMNDILTSGSSAPTNPTSLLPVVTAVFNSLVGSRVLSSGTTCVPPGSVSGPGAGLAGLTWTYTMSGATVPATTSSSPLTVDGLVVTAARVPPGRQSLSGPPSPYPIHINGSSTA
jgi:Flp pilus assembly protein TadG